MILVRQFVASRASLGAEEVHHSFSCDYSQRISADALEKEEAHLSAAEILTRPAGPLSVLDLIGSWTWQSPALRARRFALRLGKHRRKGTLAQRLFLETYKARNDFLHLHSVCALMLYRCMLHAFIAKQWPKVQTSPAPVSYGESLYEEAVIRLARRRADA